MRVLHAEARRWTKIRRVLILSFVWCFACGARLHAADAVWQWSVPMGDGRAFLWIPENCAHVRAVLVAQHNMIEEGILEHAAMRRTLSERGIAEVFIAPPFDRVFQFDRGAGERFDALMHALATESGYDELGNAPAIPIGHSACASYPWNFAAWNPQRTLAVLSVKGDAPKTELTGSGAPNPEWGDRRIDGIPGLMVMSEYEWWDARLAPLLTFRAAHPATPLALLADVGHGHFDASEELVTLLALFIRKAVETRLGADAQTLVSLDPAHGWLIDRWRGDEPPRCPAAPAGDYRGNRAEATWCFDEETARAFEAYYASNRRKRVQQVDFVQGGKLAPISTMHAGVELKFLPQDDGVTFRIAGDFIEPLPPRKPIAAKDKPPPPTITTPTRAADKMHARRIVDVLRITGPIESVTDDTFRVALNRTFSTNDQRKLDAWFVASARGDEQYKSTVQQAVLHLLPNTEGADQLIDFPAIPTQKLGASVVPLRATSDAGAAVRYFVREGPAAIEGDRLRLTAIPPRARFPIRVTVVAWQWGRDSAPKLKTATPVERSFSIER